MKNLIVGDQATVARLAKRLKVANSHSEYQRIQCVLIPATLGGSAREIAQLRGWSTATVHVMHSRWAKEGDAIFEVRRRGGRHHQHLNTSTPQPRAGAGAGAAGADRAACPGWRHAQRQRNCAGLPRTHLQASGALDDLLVPAYFSLFEPSKLRGDMIDSLHAAVATVLQDKSLVDLLAGRGLIVSPSTPAAVQEAALRDRSKFAKLIGDANIKIN